MLIGITIVTQIAAIIQGALGEGQALKAYADFKKAKAYAEKLANFANYGQLKGTLSNLDSPLYGNRIADVTRAFDNGLYNNPNTWDYTALEQECISRNYLIPSSLKKFGEVLQSVLRDFNGTVTKLGGAGLSNYKNGKI